MIHVFRETLKNYKIKPTWFVAFFIVLAVFAAVSNIIGVYATGSMTQAANLGITDGVMDYLVILTIAWTVQAVFGGVMALVEKRAYGKVIHTIRRFFAERLLHMPYKEFDRKNSGEGASLFTVDIPQTASFLTVQALSQIAQLTTLLLSVVFMLFINWWLTLGYFILFPVLAILQAKIATPIGIKREEASKRRAEYNSVVSDALQNPLTVLAYGLENSVENRFKDSFSKYYKADYSAAKTGAGLALVGIFATLLPIFGFYFVASIVVINGGMTIAEFIALTIIASPAADWLTMFSQDLARLQTAKASVVRVSGFIPDRHDEYEDTINILTDADHCVHFNEVTFSYDDNVSDDIAGDDTSTGDDKNERLYVFDKTSFTIDKNGITAIAGPSGCGKSTALKLMLGLYKPDSGDITLSSKNITYVPQDCHLLPVSIRENITAGLESDDEKLKKACKNAGIYDFITALPDGFDSILIESAANISGGQKQRLAMARAFYRNADILLLDEATSALDPVTELAVLESFRSYINDNNKTAIVVAHRQAVLDMSDRVITLSPDLIIDTEVPS